MMTNTPEYVEYPDDIDELITDHKHVADSIAYRVWNTARHSLELDDIQGWAYEGLVQAAHNWESYCAENNYSPLDLQFFTPYSQRRIHGNIYDYLRKVDWATRSQRTLAKQIQQADKGMGLSESEISELTGLSIEEVHSNNAEMARRKAISFDSGISEMYEPRTTDVSSTAEANRLLEVAVDAIRDCTYDQQVVLALHYFAERDLQDVAKEMQIPEQVASKLHTAAVMAVYETMKLEAENV